MQLTGETEIAAPRRRVWDVVTDPNQVAACLPGDPHIEVVDDRHFRATGQVGNLLMRTKVTVEIELTELVEPERAQAGATATVMGSPATASGWMTLTELTPSSTHLVWSAELTLAGMLAGFAGMVQAPIQRGIDETLACLKARLEAPTPAD